MEQVIVVFDQRQPDGAWLPFRMEFESLNEATRWSFQQGCAVIVRAVYGRIF